MAVKNISNFDDNDKISASKYWIDTFEPKLNDYSQKKLKAIVDDAGKIDLEANKATCNKIKTFKKHLK
jgi:hypothetical protein